MSRRKCSRWPERSVENEASTEFRTRGDHWGTLQCSVRDISDNSLGTAQCATSAFDSMEGRRDAGTGRWAGVGWARTGCHV